MNDSNDNTVVFLSSAVYGKPTMEQSSVGRQLCCFVMYLSAYLGKGTSPFVTHIT